MDNEDQRSDEVELEVVGQVPSPAIALGGEKGEVNVTPPFQVARAFECLLLFGLLSKWVGQLVWEEELGRLHCSSHGSLNEASSLSQDSDTFLSCF